MTRPQPNGTKVQKGLHFLTFRMICYIQNAGFPLVRSRLRERLAGFRDLPFDFGSIVCHLSFRGILAGAGRDRPLVVVDGSGAVTGSRKKR